jgi:hypothetical protein
MAPDILLTGSPSLLKNLQQLVGRCGIQCNSIEIRDVDPNRIPFVLMCSRGSAAVALWVEVDEKRIDIFLQSSRQCCFRRNRHSDSLMHEIEKVLRQEGASDPAQEVDRNNWISG